MRVLVCDSERQEWIHPQLVSVLLGIAADGRHVQRGAEVRS